VLIVVDEGLRGMREKLESSLFCLLSEFKLVCLDRLVGEVGLTKTS